MNGDSYEKMGEPVDSDVPKKQDKKTEHATNAIDENSENHTFTNSPDKHVDKYLADVNISNSIDAQGDSQDTETIDTDDSEVSQKVCNDKPPHLHNNDSNGGTFDGRESCGIIDNNSNNHLKGLQSLSDPVNSCEDSQGDSQVETNDSDDNSDVSKHANNFNGLKSNCNNFDDEISMHDEDTVEDTMSSGETELERLRDFENILHTGDPKIETLKIVTIKRHYSDGENSSEYSESEADTKIEDTVSLHSNSDDPVTGDNCVDNGEPNKSDEIIILKNDGIDSHNETYKSPEVHEIHSDNSDNDDCVVTAVEQVTKETDTRLSTKKKKVPKAKNTIVELRRSSRTVKRKKYNDVLDGGSDIEEMENPIKSKSKHIAIKNTIAMAEMISKQLKSKTYQKKATTIVTNSPIPLKSYIPHVNKSASSALNKNIYQKIASRGICLTPVTSKTTSTQATQVNMNTCVPVLPTLTDEMFVVEAPSFIVPYVYEKPAIVPFKDFVDKWGKEIEEEQVKEAQALAEKKKEEKAKREQMKKEDREGGEDKSDEEINSDETKKKVEKAERKERRRRHREDDDVSWDGSSSDESEDDIISDEEGQMAIKDKADIVEEIKEISSIGPTTKSESYFDLCLGKFFMNIGLNLVQEYVQTDLLNQENRKLLREKKAGHNTKNREDSIALLTKNLELSRKSNEPFKLEQKKCKICTFKTESALAMARHLETPHVKNNLYRCNYCTLEIKSPHDILYHMEKEHSVKGRLELAPALNQCTYCPFEDHGKGRLARHLITCAKKFKPESNLAPPVEWDHPAKIAKVARARNAAPFHASQFGRQQADGAPVSNLRIPIVNAATPRARAALPAPHSLSTGLLIRHAAPQTTYPINNAKTQMNQSITITPLPRQSSTMYSQHAANAKGFVTCEICDGYIKNLEQLRNHMQWIHKVKIHPKMIYNRPPLNCQKCQFRFFTDQGLERHLLGSHGLVTSAIQEAANKGKDAGRCPVCGRVYQWKLLAHVSRDHNMVLKPAHLSYKCTVCTATFGMYRQFESHVYSAHSVVAKRVMDKKAATASKANANYNAARQLKINDEITIIPQSVKAPTRSS